MAKIAAKNSSCVITALGPPPLFGVWAIAYAKSTMKWSLRSFDALGRVAHGFYPIIRRLSPIAGREPSSLQTTRYRYRLVSVAFARRSIDTSYRGVSAWPLPLLTPP